MAQFQCMECDYEGAFFEFKTGSHTEVSEDEDSDDEIDVDETNCPACGSESVVEL